MFIRGNTICWLIHEEYATLVGDVLNLFPSQNSFWHLLWQRKGSAAKASHIDTIRRLGESIGNLLTLGQVRRKHGNTYIRNCRYCNKRDGPLLWSSWWSDYILFKIKHIREAKEVAHTLSFLHWDGWPQWTLICGPIRRNLSSPTGCRQFGKNWLSYKFWENFIKGNKCSPATVITT